MWWGHPEEPPLLGWGDRWQEVTTGWVGIGWAGVEGHTGGPAGGSQNPGAAECVCHRGCGRGEAGAAGSDQRDSPSAEGAFERRPKATAHHLSLTCSTGCRRPSCRPPSCLPIHALPAPGSWSEPVGYPLSPGEVPRIRFCWGDPEGVWEGLGFWNAPSVSRELGRGTGEGLVFLGHHRSPELGCVVGVGVV